MHLLKRILERKVEGIVKRTLSLLTLLNLVMMTAGASIVLADKDGVIASEPTAFLVIFAGLLTIIGISMRKNK